jgi:hypothetical protein
MAVFARRHTCSRRYGSCRTTVPCTRHIISRCTIDAADALTILIASTAHPTMVEKVTNVWPARGWRLTSFGPAWLALTLALAAHVTDEAVTGFLSVYNPIVLGSRVRFGWFPMPTFTFGVWLGGLIAAVFALLVISPLAFRGSRSLRLFAYFYAVMMIFNGFGHLAGSLYFHRWMPGATTAPLLLVTSVWLLLQIRHR